MRKFKRITSIILATLMVMSLFAAVPMTVNAAPPGSETGHALTLYANNGTDQQYTTGKQLLGITKISDPSYYQFTTPAGKTFRCWNTAADGTGTDYASGSDYVHRYADLTLYAQWGYTVTWKDWDDTLLKTEVLAEGTTPTYNGTTPTKAEDEKYTYTFEGWSPEITAVTGDVTYTAQYTATFKGITSDELYKGRVIDARTPIKFMMRINKQIYLGIDLHVYLDDTLVKDLQSTVGEATEPDRYYTTTKKCIVDTYSGQPGMPSIHTLYLKSLYTVTWKDEDGTVLKTEDVAKGDTPSYGATPTKAEDENNTYTFAGWTPEITAVTGNAEYTAQFTAVPKPKKLILNVGENGKVVMDNGTFGNATDASNITEKSAPVNVVDGSKIFIVDGRSANLVEGGSINIATGGEVSFYPSADNTGKITAIPDEGYALYGWYDGDTLYSEDTVLAYQNIDKTTTLTAVFAPAHTVTWKDAGGTILRTDTIAEGKTPSYGSTPTKAEDENYTYAFAGWTPAIAPVTEDVTYTANFTAVPKGINYGEGYINPKGTQAIIDENNFGLNMNSYLNMQILGIQLKNSIATEGGADGVRFVTAVNSNLLKGNNIDDYGYIVAKIGADVESLYSNMDKFTADKFSKDKNRFSCKGTSNSISGDFGQYSTETDYKYVTLAVTGTSEQSGNLIARFYVKTKDGKYHYADYINGNNQTYSGMAFDLSAVEANLH